MVAVAAIAWVILLLFLGALLPPETDRFTMVASLVWTLLAPHFVVVSLVCLTLATVASRRVPRRVWAPALAIATGSLVASLYVTLSIVRAADAAGGSVNPFKALVVDSIGSARPDSRELIGNVDGRPLLASVYLPRGGDSGAPVFVYIHGGGWVSGQPDHTAHDLRWFADHGWLVVSLGYPLATASYATWNKAPGAVACGLAWAAENAHRFGGGASRLVLAGDSAGGNLAINLAYGAAIGKARSSCGGRVPVPDAVVTQYPVVNPAEASESGRRLRSTLTPKRFTARYLGGSPKAHPDRLRAITSSTYLSSKAPPTLIIEPDNDGLIPTGSVLDFARHAASMGVEISLVHVPFANHAYDTLAAGSLGNQLHLSVTEHYLEKRGLAPPG
jgi:acetyl esterase/lipase